MIRAWLDLSPIGIFTCLILVYAGSTLLLAVFTFRSPFAKCLQTLNGVVPSYFSAVAILFALLTGFLTNDIGERGRQAIRAVQTEAAELRNIHILSIAAASDMKEIRAALKTYVTSIVTDEWPAMGEQHASPATNAAYDALLREVSDPAVAKDSGASVQAALLNATLRASTARNDRLALSYDHTNDLKWLVVIVLGFLTQLAIAVVHLDRPRAFLTSLLLFSAAIVVALGVIALQEYPFEGAFRVSPAPIEALRGLGD